MTIDRWLWAPPSDKPALEFGAARLSYGEMREVVVARARSLAGQGVARGDRVAWYGMNHAEVFVLLFACARLGAMLMPLNWRLAPGEIAEIVANAEPKLVIHDRHFAEAAQALGLPAFAHDALPEGAVEDAGGSEDDPLLLVYTSGSTGAPKGVVLTQAALVANAAMSVEAHDLRPADRVLNVLPLFHVGGLNILPTPAFSIGATVVLHERFEPVQMARALGEVTHAISVPTVLQAVLATSEWEALDLSGLRAVSIGSTDVPRALIDAVQARGVPVLQIYGATETAPLAIYQSVADAMGSAGSIGRAGSRCGIRLMADGAEAAPGAPGEIWVRGGNVMSHYWRAPELTAAAMVDGWFRTGDVAIRDAAGLYWFADRIKHVIISGGENIFPAEIERVLRTAPGVQEVAVVGRADAKWGAVPVAVVVPDPDGVTEATVLGALTGRIAKFKQPRQVVFVDALPRNAMGKVVIDAVRQMV